MLEIYEKSETECDVDITFKHAIDGSQQNDCRDLICGFLNTPSQVLAHELALRLESMTDARSGMGLLFLIAGKEGKDHKIVISRFPTDNAIYVEDNKTNFTVEFLERVFMKNKSSYKSVVYRDASLSAGIWSGRATDKQLNNPVGEVSNYWILDFLASQLTVTSAAGTRRMAIAMQSAAKKSDLKVKQEIVAAAALAPGLGNKQVSVREIGERFALSPEAISALSGEFKRESLLDERFIFDTKEFQDVIAFKSVELDNGVTLSAASEKFSEVVMVSNVPGKDKLQRFTTEGQIVNEKLKARSQ